MKSFKKSQNLLKNQNKISLKSNMKSQYKKKFGRLHCTLETCWLGGSFFNGL